MRLYMRIFFVVIVVFGFGSAHSDAQNSGAWSLHFPLPEMTAWVNFPEPVEKIAQILEEEQNSHSMLKAWVFAVGIDTSIEPLTSGQWDTLPGKGLVWRMGIYAENALSLNLFIEKYRMQAGMALYVYSNSLENMAGPFDTRQNANGGVLPVQSLSGDRIIVEWNIPFHSSFSILHSPFSIASVGYGFRDVAVHGKIVSLATAASCNVDINCRTGNHWQREKRSVVRLETIIRTGSTTKTQYCTGTLVNQAVEANRKRPYILTANHCVSTEDMAQNTTFVFGYEKAYCNESNPSFIPSGISGSNLVATKRELDFTLLELSGNVTDVHHPYYAGWNTSPAAPLIATGIHHPQGDAKKISVTKSTLGTGTFTDEAVNLYCDKNAHWIVRSWSEGVTENGSSGSSIFDEEHRVVGILSGGAANCSNPVNDYYSKFSEQWDSYASKNESLKPWLDPDNKGVTSIWGFDPLAPYEDRCDTLGHIGRNEAKTLVESGTKGYLTSINDRDWISFAEKINNDTIAQIIGMEVHIANVFKSGSKVRFAVWNGNDFPIAPLYMKDTIVPAYYNNYPMHVYFNKTLELTGNYFVGYSLEYSDPADDFSVYQSGLRPYAGISGMYVENSNGNWMALDDYEPPIYSSLGIRVMGRFGKQNQSYNLSTYRNLKIFFQQGSNTVSVLFDIEEQFELLQTVKIECYDMSGKRMLLLNNVKGMMGMYSGKTYMQVEIDVANLPPGMYLIGAIDENNKWAGKFIKY